MEEEKINKYLELKKFFDNELLLMNGEKVEYVKVGEGKYEIIAKKIKNLFKII